jgi:hypothetical protein
VGAAGARRDRAPRGAPLARLRGRRRRCGSGDAVRPPPALRRPSQARPGPGQAPRGQAGAGQRASAQVFPQRRVTPGPAVARAVHPALALRRSSTGQWRGRAPGLRVWDGAETAGAPQPPVPALGCPAPRKTKGARPGRRAPLAVGRGRRCGGTSFQGGSVQAMGSGHLRPRCAPRCGRRTPVQGAPRPGALAPVRELRLRPGGSGRVAAGGARGGAPPITPAAAPRNHSFSRFLIPQRPRPTTPKADQPRPGRRGAPPLAAPPGAPGYWHSEHPPVWLPGASGPLRPATTRGKRRCRPAPQPPAPQSNQRGRKRQPAAAEAADRAPGPSTAGAAAPARRARRPAPRMRRRAAA